MLLSAWRARISLASVFAYARARERRLPLAVANGERDPWIACPGKLIEEIGAEKPLPQQLQRALFPTADFMGNKADDGQAKWQSLGP
jgi:hypothetical protein